jgi:hypothetical protein
MVKEYLQIMTGMVQANLTPENYILQFVVSAIFKLINKELYGLARMPPPPQHTIADFFRKFDHDKNGLISYYEFRNFVFKFNGI